MLGVWCVVCWTVQCQRKLGDVGEMLEEALVILKGRVQVVSSPT